MGKDTRKASNKSQEKYYPPVVAVLGHVDHGKTTLLDALAKSNVVGKEHGGITQKIGAYQIEVEYEEKKRKITFIDTPGHEAFLKIRSRGTSASDIALLVVASDDGLMPQTEESIQHIREAKIPFIVVLTKADLESANPQRVKQQLVKAGLSLEGFGGDVPSLSVSAKTGTGIKELLELILLVSAMHEINKNEDGPFSGVIIESWVDPRIGPLATIIVKSGKIKVADTIVCEKKLGKVKALFSSSHTRLKEAFPGDPVEVLGFSKVVPIGGLVESFNEEKLHSGSADQVENNLIPQSKSLPQDKTLSIILKADTEGSLEAITQSLPATISVIDKGTGSITETDVFLAKTSRAIIIGFNAKLQPGVDKFAQTEGVPIKTYAIIYELLKEVQEVAESLQQDSDNIIGRAEILASFPYKKTKVLGVRILEGYLNRGAKIVLTRDGEKLGKATIASIRQQKEERTRAEKSQECGVLLSQNLDFSLGDMLLSYNS